MSLVRSLLLMIFGCYLAAGNAHAQTGCVPNPNLSGPPFVNGCPFVAGALNTIMPVPTAVIQNIGESTGHVLIWGDKSATLSPADHLQLVAQNPLIITAQVTGTPTAGKKPGVAVTLNGVTYTVTYTVQSSDTTNTLITTGLQNCLRNDTGGPVALLPNVTAGLFCTASPSSLTQALLALPVPNFTAASNASLGNGTNFNLPFAATNIVGVSDSPVTVTTTPNGSTANTTTDVGPYFSAVCYSPTRPAKAGDHCGIYRMDGTDSTGASVNTQYAGMSANVISPTAGATIGEWCAGTSHGGNPAFVPLFCVSQGIYGTQNDGATKLSDLGFGTTHFGPITIDNGDSINRSQVTAGGIIITSNNTSATGISIGNTSSGGTTWNIQEQGSALTAGQLDLAVSGVGLHVSKTTGHVFSDGYLRSAATKPSLSSCGGGTPAISGNAQAGTVTPGTGAPTACTLTWGTAFTQNVACTIEVVTTAGVTHAITGQSATSITVAFSASPSQFNYVCLD
jgi:hypothetical protein